MMTIDLAYINTQCYFWMRENGKFQSYKTYIGITIQVFKQECFHHGELTEKMTGFMIFDIP